MNYEDRERAENLLAMSDAQISDFVSAGEHCAADVVALHGIAKEYRESKAAFDKELRTLERQIGLLRCYNDMYGKDVGTTMLLGKDLFKHSKDAAVAHASENIAYVEDAHIMQILQDTADKLPSDE